MSIRYLCGDCQDELGTRFRLTAENEVGRKSCDRCGSNRDNLYILGLNEFESLPEGGQIGKTGK